MGFPLRILRSSLCLWVRMCGKSGLSVSDLMTCVHQGKAPTLYHFHPLFSLPENSRIIVSLLEVSPTTPPPSTDTHTLLSCFPLPPCLRAQPIPFPLRPYTDSYRKEGSNVLSSYTIMFSIRQGLQHDNSSTFISHNKHSKKVEGNQGALTS